jgi:hypothetical protein
VRKGRAPIGWVVKEELRTDLSSAFTYADGLVSMLNLGKQLVENEVLVGKKQLRRAIFLWTSNEPPSQYPEATDKFTCPLVKVSLFWIGTKEIKSEVFETWFKDEDRSHTFFGYETFDSSPGENLLKALRHYIIPAEKRVN